ncbi:MAG: hypothetical protein WBE76_12070, partial [Terracidiphilus sp.]
MQLYGTRVFEAAHDRRGEAIRGRSSDRLRALAVVVLTLATGVPSGFAQQQAPQPGPATVLGAGAKAQDKA